MRSTLSPQMLDAMHSESTGEVFLPLVKLTQDGWDDAIRLVPNTEKITHMGESYDPLAFDIGLPDEEAEGIPVLNWVADNTDRRLVEALRLVRGAVQARIVWILASNPDHIEIGPIEVEMRAAQYDAQRVTGTMSVEPVMELQFGHMVMNPANAPALF
ncbi:DUF1833 family protein [Shimia sp. R9_2]|uniref:DUF1833 family protein n=1 Tax=Shimia sp. R9_2 TaxID=2821112 RepID=UPI001AD9EF8F|nr:DUF1833 family protein [Shimia sp. R9_2]MBO9398730.1 DUF1833 family protein [Shimia sp. R9_2]